MGKGEIPEIELTREAVSSENGSEERKEVSRRIREACEIHGCFLLRYEKIHNKLREDMIMAMKSLFDLPEHTKIKYIHPKPYHSYAGNTPSLPFYQSFGLDDPLNVHNLQAFTNLMWPLGNPSFCDAVKEMSWKLVEVNKIVMKMTFESFGMEKHYESQIENSTNLFRILKYTAPPPPLQPPTDDDIGINSEVALRSHTDKGAITILCQNEVQGLEIQSKDGHWSQLMVPQDSLVIIVGEALQVWSNGRLKAARHRVVIRGKEDRYSCGLFSAPKEESRIEVPLEFVDKDHPLLYKPFIYADYISYFLSKLSDDALDIYAGI